MAVGNFCTNLARFNSYIKTLLSCLLAAACALRCSIEIVFLSNFSICEQRKSNNPLDDLSIIVFFK